jgi:hypothetical protein
MFFFILFHGGSKILEKCTVFQEADSFSVAIYLTMWQVRGAKASNPEDFLKFGV